MSHVDGPPGYEPVDMGSVRPEDLDGVPAPGALGIKEKRTWKTWQLVGAVVIAVLVGMLINYRTVGASASGGVGHEWRRRLHPAATGGSRRAPPFPPEGARPARPLHPGFDQHLDVQRGDDHHHYQGEGLQGHHDDHHDLVKLWIDRQQRRPRPRLDCCLDRPKSEGNWTSPGFHDHGTGLEHRLGLPVHPGSHDRNFVPGVRHPCGRCAGQCCGNKRNRRVWPGCYGSDEPR